MLQERAAAQGSLGRGEAGGRRPRWTTFARLTRHTHETLERSAECGAMAESSSYKSF